MNKKEFYLETVTGDLLLVEVQEHHGCVVLTIGDKRYDLTPDASFDLVDAITMVANGVESHTGEE